MSKEQKSMIQDDEKMGESMMSDNNTMLVYRCTVCWTVQEGFVERQKMLEGSGAVEDSSVGHCSLCGVADALFKCVQRDAAHERTVVEQDLQKTI